MRAASGLAASRLSRSGGDIERGEGCV
jgi:hypothetical protein